MTELAEQAYKRKEEYFYCKPVGPDSPNGPQKLSEPKYEYGTEKEYNNIFQNIERNNLEEIFETK